MDDLLPAWVHELTPGAVGIWGLLAVVIVALIKAWPIIDLQRTAAREKLRAEGRDDLHECKERIDKLQDRLEVVSKEMHGFEMKLVGAVSAYRILDAEVQIISPESPALVQARAVMSQTFTISPSTDASFEMPRGLE